MTDFKVCSLNVRGLREQLKRREIFNWLRAKNYSIYLLQETHRFIKIALALNRLALVKHKTNGLLTAKVPVLIPLTGK